MKHRRLLFALALAALGSSTSLACILSLDDPPDAGSDAGDGSTEGGASVKIDASPDGAPTVGDAMTDADAAPAVAMFMCSDGGLFWDGASPAELVVNGTASLNNIHLEVVQGAGPAFHVRVYDKGIGDADLGTGYFPPCTSSFDDDGSTHSWGLDAGGVFSSNYDFYYEFTVLDGDGGSGRDLKWQYKPTIDVQALAPGYVPGNRSNEQATCFAAGDACTQVDAD